MRILLKIALAMFAGAAVAAPLDAGKVQQYLFDTARAGDAALVKELLAAGANIDARNDAGYTALILAAYNGRAAAVEALLAAGADPNAANRYGMTPQHGAIFKGEEAIALKLLADPRTNPDARNGAGQTAAMFAALFGKAALIDALAARGADFAASDAAGQTAHGLAAQQGNAALAERIATLASVSVAPAPARSR